MILRYRHARAASAPTAALQLADAATTPSGARPPSLLRGMCTEHRTAHPSPTPPAADAPRNMHACLIRHRTALIAPLHPGTTRSVCAGTTLTHSGAQSRIGSGHTTRAATRDKEYGRGAGGGSHRSRRQAPRLPNTTTVGVLGRGGAARVKPEEIRTACKMNFGGGHSSSFRGVEATHRRPQQQTSSAPLKSTGLSSVDYGRGGRQ